MYLESSSINPLQGVNAEFTYVLTSTSTSLPVKIDPNTGRLTVSNSIKFDRESFVNGIITVQVNFTFYTSINRV